MSPSSSAPAPGNGSSFSTTPARDREHERLPFPKSANPSPAPSQRHPTTSSASTSLTSLALAPSSSQHTLTVDSLLKHHAAAADPKSAALEQAVHDRNALSAQNSQLWKLIEKQKAGYNQMLKEIERIRGERDTYKSRLGALNGASGADAERRLKGERITRSTGSETISRKPLNAINSDDIGTSQSSQSSHSLPHLHSSRSHDNFNEDSSLQSQPPPSSAPSVLHSPSPLSIRTSKQNSSNIRRAETNPLPVLSSTSPQDIQPTFNDTFANIATNNANKNNGINPLQPLRASTYPRKSSLAESVTSVLTSGSSFSVSSPSTTTSSLSHHGQGIDVSSQYPPDHQQFYNSSVLEVTTPTSSTSDSHIHQRASISTITPLPQPVLHLVTAPATPNRIPATSSPFLEQSKLQLTTLEAPPHILSRDSRISLPEEARQYIANMADSPVPSPRVGAFVISRPKLSSALALPQQSNASISDRESEFLDMDEEEEEEEEEEQISEVSATVDSRQNDFDSIDEDPGINNNREKPSKASESPSDSDQRHPLQQHYVLRTDESKPPNLTSPSTKRREKIHAAAEDFPLPPSTNITVQLQQITTAQEAPDRQSPHTPLQPSITTFSQHTKAMDDRESNRFPPPAYQSSDVTSLTENSSQLSLISKNGQQSQLDYQSASFRALPLLSSDLPNTLIIVSHSFVRPNDRGKEVLSFIVYVDPGSGKEGWKVEKLYSDVLKLDHQVRISVGKGIGKKIVNLPEGKLWRDHAPAKVDQRKAVLENYLQNLINLPVKNNDEVIAFFTSDIVRETKQPVMQAGHKEGYLTKRGKNFGGWKTRYFVLQGPVLEYYDCRGGNHLGSITVTGAQIGRQQRTERAPATDEEKEYRHAFLIVEARKGPGGNHPRHVLCAESDEDRDSWVEMLVRYFTGTYSEEPINYASSSSSVPSAYQSAVNPQPRSSTSSSDVTSAPSRRPPLRGLSKDDISISKGAAIPISQLNPDASNAKLFQTLEDSTRSSSPTKSLDPSPTERQGPGDTAFETRNQNIRRTMERSHGLPSSLPDSSPLSTAQPFPLETVNGGQRAYSELGHYPDLQDGRGGQNNGGRQNQRQLSPEQHRARDISEARRSFHPTLNPVASSPTSAVPSERERVPSPEKLDVNGKVKISGPLNGAPIPSGFKFGAKDATSSEATASDRREKAKSRSFWGFGKATGEKFPPTATFSPRAVFGVPLEEALDVAQICNLPAIVFRSIQYLQAKKADQEEGIYRLSGSSAVIKSLKDRFNNEGDVDLLASDEYWDPHAIAGLLKSFLRELPASILTRELHLRFLAVIDFVDSQERIRELSQLIAALPIANYTLLRALTAHLILIVQNSSINKMTMRNVGIVFSPTLGIPAGVFSLMLGEFNRVFNVDADNQDLKNLVDEEAAHGSPQFRRNSRQYTDAAADQLLGLTVQTLAPAEEETNSEGDELSVEEENGAETTEGETIELSSTSSLPSANPHQEPLRGVTPETPIASKTSRASHVASSRGLNVTVSDRGNRHSRMMGLPTSPRPPHSPLRPPDAP